MKSNSKIYSEEFTARFNTYSDNEIISAFNCEVGKQGWGTARAAFLCSIHDEFDRRNFDYSSIGSKEYLSFKNPIRLNDNKRITIQINA